MNKKIEEVLRCFVDHNQSNWDLLLTDVEVAYNQSTNSVTTHTPFYLAYGFNPKTVPFDLIRGTNDKVPAAAEWLSSLSAAHKTATDAIRQANAYRAAYANRSRRTCDLKVGDYVLLSTKNLMPESYQGARKLMPKYSGPYRITEAVTPVTFRLDLPTTVLERKVHNAFHASLLTPYRADKNFDRRPVPAPPVALTDGTVEYEVIKILRSRKRRGRTQYLVSWKGYDDTENQWISEADLHAPALLRAFHKRGAS